MKTGLEFLKGALTVRGATTTGVYATTAFLQTWTKLPLGSNLPIAIGLTGTLIESYQNGYSPKQTAALGASYLVSTQIARALTGTYILPAMLTAMGGQIDTRVVVLFGSMTVVNGLLAKGAENVSKKLIGMAFNSEFPEPKNGRSL